MVCNARLFGGLVVGLGLVVPLALAQGEPSGAYGMLEFGSSVERRIAGLPQGGAELLVFHTYVVEVPAGVDSVDVAVEGFGHDMDVAVKVGAPIVDYEDVDVLDVEDTLDPQVTVEAPGGTRVYVDVLNLLPAEARYRLTVTAADGGRVEAGGEVGGADAVGEADREERRAGNPLAGARTPSRPASTRSRAPSKATGFAQISKRPTGGTKARSPWTGRATTCRRPRTRNASRVGSGATATRSRSRRGSRATRC
ncbi:MAG: hypothetical protein U5K81_01280 [Trueperaceae bacterium]|nr:hypothetical protein [Trueperaceae bacterium]